MRQNARTSVLSILLATVLAACQRTPQAEIAAGTPSRPVDAARLNDANSDLSDWLTYGRTYGEQRFSPLNAIDAGNVRKLKLAWYVDLPRDDQGEESTALVVDGVMYVTSSWGRVLALDGATGKMRWQYDPRVPREWGINACCGAVNRGVAIWKGKVYLATLDGRLIALDARDGKVLWQTLVIDRAERASITGAPRVIRGRVYIGSAGGELGVRGRLTAVDAETGAILWRFFTVPTHPASHPGRPHLRAAEGTWSGQWWTRGGGGTVWDAMSYDPWLDLLYIGTGNGSPWPQSIRSPSGGDNLYVSSILALHAATGQLAWHYQTTPGDEWGFDAASQMVLTDLDIGGRRRTVLIQAAANGFVYVLDRANGELISATPFVPVNWATAVDPVTGRPTENPQARYSRTGKPFVVRPGPQGAHSWQPMAFDPANGLLYIPAMVNAAQLSVSPSDAPSRFALTFGAAVSRPKDLAPNTSRLIAWNPVLQRAVWSVERLSPVASGVLATAGSLVFQGSTEGTLEAFSADTGKPLWKFEVGTSLTAAPITYSVNGMQMLAVVAGRGGAGLMRGGALAAREVAAHNTPRLLVFSLQGTARLPPSAPAGASPRAPERFGTPAQLERGGTLYARYCARCHGQDTINAGPLEGLGRSKRLANPVLWQRVVYAGLLAPQGMPGFMPELKPNDVEALRAYVVDQVDNEESGSASERQNLSSAKGLRGELSSASRPTRGTHGLSAADRTY